MGVGDIIAIVIIAILNITGIVIYNIDVKKEHPDQKLWKTILFSFIFVFLGWMYDIATLITYIGKKYIRK